MSHSLSHAETHTEEAVAGVPNLAAEIVDLLLRSAHLLRTILTAHFSEFGLNDVRHAVLSRVRAASPVGCSQTELAEQLNQSESSISMLVERMRNDGLLYRLRSKTDRRKRVLMLTPQGRQVLEQIDSCHNRRMDNLLRQFDSGQKQSFSALLELLIAELSKRNAAAESRGLLSATPPSRNCQP